MIFKFPAMFLGLVGVTLGLMASALAAPLTISRSAFDGSTESFASHSNYLSMVTPYGPVRELWVALRERTGLDLVTRGEAHVTVLTPPEFDRIKKRVSIADVDAVAQEMRIQSSRLEPVCVGEGRATIGGKEEKTYFLVVRSQDLLAIRHALLDLFVERGGAKAAFDPEDYQPHVTIGFTKVDLHSHQGVVKDDRACVFPIDVH